MNKFNSVSALSWGLMYRIENKEPEIGVSKTTLQSYNAYYQKDTIEKVLYLTFDAGYENGYTKKIIDILDINDINACFFLTSNYVIKNSDLVKEMLIHDNIIGNHTYSHPDMLNLNLKGLEKEITKMEECYRKYINSEISRFYRPPAGVYNYEQLEYMKNRGYKTIFWSVAYADCDNNKQYSYQKALNILKKRIYPGAIILLHSTSKTNMEILDEFIKYCQNEGYSFESLLYL